MQVCIGSIGVYMVVGILLGANPLRYSMCTALTFVCRQATMLSKHGVV